MINVISYNYSTLLFGYGPKKEVLCEISWASDKIGFTITVQGGITLVNAHSVVREQLTAHLNTRHNLAQLVQLLNETYQPLASIARLPIMPLLGVPVCILYNSYFFSLFYLLYNNLFGYTETTGTSSIILFISTIRVSDAYSLSSCLLFRNTFSYGPVSVNT